MRALGPLTELVLGDQALPLAIDVHRRLHAGCRYFPLLRCGVLPRIKPMRLTRAKPFDSPNYLFELKHDGFRAIAYIDDGNAELVSRNQNRFAFGSLKIALAQLPVKNAILDGEVVCLDRYGVSQFNQLLARKTPPIFYAFDLLWLNGKDLRKLPLQSEVQGRILHSPDFGIRFLDFFL